MSIKIVTKKVQWCCVGDKNDEHQKLNTEKVPEDGYDNQIKSDYEQRLLDKMLLGNLCQEKAAR